MDIKAVFINILKKIYNTGFDMFLKILSAIFKLFPLKERVCFYSIRANGALLDNARCVYEKLDCDKIVVANMLPHSKKKIIEIYKKILTSKVIVTDDYFKYLRYVNLRKEQKVVQIWHACGAFKKFGLDAPAKMSEKMERKTHSRYDAVCVSAEDVKKYYSSAFGISENKIFATGVARTDMLFDQKYLEKTKDEFFSKYEFLKDKKIYLYAPTFREKEGKQYKFDFQIDFERLSKELADDEVFVLKRHPIMKESYFENGQYENVVDLSDESVLTLLIVADTVVTDYSSVIFEAALLNRKTVFYCPDLKEYDRSFYLQYPDDLPGEICEKSQELLEMIRCAKLDEKLDRFKSKQLSACDGNSTERTAKLVMNFLK